MKLFFYVAILFIGGLFLWIVYPYNLGVDPDGANYISIAKSIVNGKGVVSFDGEYETHWPPGYPILLSLGSIISSQSILSVGKYLNLFLLITLGITFRNILKQLRLSKVIVFVFPLILLISYPITISRYFASELPFITLLSIILWCFIKWVNTKTLKYLFLCGVLSGYLLIIRYAGAGFIAGFFLFMVLSKDSFKEKFKFILIYVTPIMVFFLIWQGYVYLFVGHPSVNRTLIPHIVSINKVGQSILTLVSWFTGEIKHHVFHIAILPFLGLIGIIVYSLNRRRSQFYSFFIRNSKYFSLFFISISTYYLFLLFSISFVDAGIPMDNRMLSPIFIYALLVFALILHFVNVTFEAQKYFVLIFSLLVFVLLLPSSVVWKQHYYYGSGYTGQKFAHYREIFEGLSLDNSANTIIYSNASDFYSLYNNKTVKYLPKKYIPQHEGMNENYKQELLSLKDAYNKNKAQILFLYDFESRVAFMKLDDIKENFDMEEAQYFDGGFLLNKKK